MSKKKFVWTLIILLGFSALSLQASDSFLDIKLRVFEGIKEGMTEPPRFVTSSYLRPTLTASIQIDFGLEKEKGHIQRVFNLKSVNLLTEADLKFGTKEKSSVSHFFRLNGNEYKVHIMLLGWKNKGDFLILVNEHINDKPENVLTTEMILLGGNIAVFGFEDRKGKPYFLSFHITGPKDKVLPPPPPPPPARKKIKKEIAEFEEGAVRAVGDVKPPKLLKKVDPVYPEEAREEGISGVVLLSVRADKEGYIEQIKIVKSPHELLSKASVEAVKQWKYQPMYIKDKPMPIIFTVTISFKLEDEEKEKEEEIAGFEEGAVIAEGDVKPPKLVKKINPIYPDEARKEGIEGAVILKVRTDKEGGVEKIRVLESPHVLLSHAAIEAVKQWKYEPMLKKGSPVPIIFTVTVSFKLK
ncbi:MAG: TonB family protein [Candidatus Aminicenantes bacterium]|nr:TonB family protein [Candidatus Aminicenantes bacterium]